MLPYVTRVPEDDRIVPVVAFFQAEANDWHLYVRHSGTELIRLADGEVIDGSYLATAPADSKNDIEFPLATLILQRLSFSDVLGALGPLENDIHRCAHVLEKYQLFWRSNEGGHRSAPLLVESELEYLLFLLRSFYDGLQKVVRAAARHPLCKAEQPPRLAMQELPGQFSKVVMDGQNLRGARDLISTYGMYESLAGWYETEAPVFRVLKELRDGIAHHGSRPPVIFETEWGFAVDPSQEPWRRFNVWPEERFRKGRLGSLRRLVGRLILHALGTTSRLADSIRSSVSLAPVVNERRCAISLGAPLVGTW